MKINTIPTDKHLFLQRLENIANCPKKLYIVGNLPEKNTTTIAIVGSRKPTAYGREVTEKLTTELCRAGINIVSGLALGIDSIAHRAALDAHGVTLAVLANGLDTVYPKSHAGLAKQIVDSGGALISEYSVGTPPLPHQFLARNRIVSGLADGIVVVEAAAKSGTLSTATHALEQGKDVFAVPGNITSPLSSGCNSLIRQGATPVTSTQDILDVIAPSIKSEQTQFILGDTPEETVLIELLQKGVNEGDQLLELSYLDSETLNQTLTMLEIKGIVRPLGGDTWTLR